MAALGVAHDAGVHGRLDAPAPLQVPHGVLVQVAGQDRGQAWAHPAGRELQGTVGSDEARMVKESPVRAQLMGCQVASACPSREPG